MKRFLISIPVVALAALFLTACSNGGGGVIGSGPDGQLQTFSTTGIISNVPDVSDLPPQDDRSPNLEGVIVLASAGSFAVTDETDIRGLKGDLIGIGDLEVGQKVEVQFHRPGDVSPGTAQNTASRIQFVTD